MTRPSIMTRFIITIHHLILEVRRFALKIVLRTAPGILFFLAI